MATTQDDYIGNGSKTNYTFTFEYLKETDVKVQLDAADHFDWHLANATTVAFDTAPESNVKIKIYRETDTDTAPGTFYAGSAIKSEDLNDNFTQSLYASQEINARYLSNLGGTMTGDLTMGEDADVVFEGATDNTYETTLTVADPTADRIITLPNVTGTVITTGDTGTVTHTMLAADCIDGDNIQNDVINSEHYAADSIDTEHYAANSVDSTALAADAVTGAQLADNSVDSEHYVDGSIDTVHIGDAQINTSKIAGDAIITPHIQDQNITTDKIADQNITTAKLADTQVTLDKIENVADGKIIVGNGSNRPTAVAVSGDVTIANTGAVTIAAGAIENGMMANNSVASGNIVNGTIVDTDINSSAAISQSKVALDAELVTLAGMPGATASILASATALTSTTAELNLLDGKSVVTSVSGSSTDVQLPTAKAVNDQIVAIVQDIGGFYPIDDELKFPNTNPDPNDDAGTIVSIADAGGIVVNGSGVSTTGRTLGGATVTINGIDSTLNNTTIAAGKGMLVQTTSTLNTYTYHRLVVDEAGVASAQSLVTDFNQRYQVAGSEPSNQPDGTNLAEGDLWFDTGSDKMKVYDGSNYAEVTSVGDYKLLTVVPAGASSGTPDYANTEFDLRDGGSAASVTSVGQLLISVNGVLQKPNAGTSIAGSAEGFCLADSNTIKFATAPGSGASVFVTLIGSATTVNVPATNSVAEATIQTNVVSEEKLKVSNSPTNGYFLQAQSGNSGGLTWAEADTTTIPVADESTDTSCNVVFVTAATGSLPPKTGTNLTFNSNTGQLSATSYAGDGSALTGVASTTADGCIYENDLAISNDYTIASTKGAHSVGPITVDNCTVTVNGVWVIS